MTFEADVRRRVVELLQAGLLGGAASGSPGEILDPIPVADPQELDRSDPQSWVVPVVQGDSLAGFAQLRSDLELVRYVTFEPGGYPRVDDWVDPETIKARAGALTRPGEVLGDPVLTYDRNPSRLVWAVRATSAAGTERRLYVVGDYVYEAQPPPDEPVFG